MWDGLPTSEQRLIVEHIVSTVLIELGLGVVALLGRWLLEPQPLAWFVGTDEFAMFVVFLWLLRNLGVTLWNNRERVQKLHVFVLS